MMNQFWPPAGFQTTPESLFPPCPLQPPSPFGSARPQYPASLGGRPASPSPPGGGQGEGGGVETSPLSIPFTIQTNTSPSPRDLDQTIRYFQVLPATNFSGMKVFNFFKDPWFLVAVGYNLGHDPVPEIPYCRVHINNECAWQACSTAYSVEDWKWNRWGNTGG